MEIRRKSSNNYKKDPNMKIHYFPIEKKKEQSLLILFFHLKLKKKDIDLSEKKITIEEIKNISNVEKRNNLEIKNRFYIKETNTLLIENEIYYFFSKNQKINFKIKNPILKENIEFNIIDLLKSKNNFILEGREIILQIDYKNIYHNANKILLDFYCRGVENIEYFHKSDPFLRIYRSNIFNEKKEDWTILYQSEFYRNNLDPDFDPFWISTKDFCNNNDKNLIKIDILDFSSKGKYQIIGTVSFQLNDIKIGNKTEWQIISKNTKSAYGTLNLKNFKEIKIKNFLKLLEKDLKINPIYLIDFTLPNYKLKSYYNTFLFLNTKLFNNISNIIKNFQKILDNYRSNKIPLINLKEINWPNLENTDKTKNNSKEFFKELRYISENYKMHKGPLEIKPIFDFILKKFKTEIKNYYFFVFFLNNKIHDLEIIRDFIFESSSMPISFFFIGMGNLDYFPDDLSKNVFKDKNGNKVLRKNFKFISFKSFGYEYETFTEFLLKVLKKHILEYYNL